jgi:adenine-specific DNA-methyltransferase
VDEGGSAEPPERSAERFPRSERDAERSPGSSNYEQTIIENLRTAGVQNTVRDERLEFETLSAHAGRWVQAMGSYRKADGSVERVAVAIGPEHGTVGSRLVREAAKESMRGAGVDLLLVCGFSFDATSPETAAELNGADDAWATSAGEQTLGSLAVQLVKMNPDLAMGDDLLKKTGAGNLFMVFGEPDVEIRAEDGKVVVELHGLDVYDPTTGVVRPHSTDDIACWFIDTDYDSESFFVRHAYFTGADKPYERLSKALKADIDPDVWETLSRTESRPFDPPSTGRIAVKVINHSGDEFLKVYEVS